MYISKLSIRNFRNFQNVSLNFNKGVNTIIGENGSGKTNLFHAIRLLIDENMPKSTKLYESDFNRSIGDWRGHWIIIQLVFKELDFSEEAQALAIHNSGISNDEESTKGTFSLFFRPRIEIRKKLFELSERRDKTNKQLQEILTTISILDYETVFTGRSKEDFFVDEDYKTYIGNFDTIIFPDPDEEKTDVFGIRTSNISIANEFAFTFAKALRDVESELRSYRDNPLLNLLRDKEKKISIEKRSEIENQVSELNDNISELEEVKGVSTSISTTIKEAVGETYAPNVNIKSELPSEINKLLQSLKLWVGDPDEEGYEGRLWELSLGGANLIYLSLKLLEFEKVKRDNKIANFILIEEPEAHVHTHVQKTFFQKLDRRETQVFISTHSTHISSVCKISSMNILARGKQKAEAYNPSINLASNKIIKLERYLDANRTNLLFAKGVILVEGDAEHILIPELIKKVLGLSLDELGVSIINIGSTGFENVAQIFHEDRVRKKCSILTDSDLSIVELPKLIEKDDIYERTCRQSEIAGKKRKQRLDSFCEDNEYVKSFYAKHTFEVDFLLEHNRFEIIETIKKEYARESDVDRITELINNKNIAIAGKEVLRLANKFGKGWFANMISENITNITGIPKYILDALLFACPSLNNTTILTIARFRLTQLINLHYQGDETNYKELQKELNSINNQVEAIDFYKRNMKNDVLTYLINSLHV